MTGYKEGLNLSSQFLSAILALMIVCSFITKASAQSPGVQLKVVGVRKIIPPGGDKRASEKLGVEYTVRFRLEISGDQGVYLLVLGPKGAPPLGHTYRDAKSISLAWTQKETSKAHRKRLTLRDYPGKGRWLSLPAMAALEWEVPAKPSGAGIQQWRSVFIKKDLNSPPTERMSSRYTVPAETP